MASGGGSRGGGGGATYWATTTPYRVNQVVVEPVQNRFFRCLVAHTATGDFYDDYLLSAFWVEVSGKNIELWATLRRYELNFDVIRANVIYRCLIAHTSGIFGTDLTAGRWIAVGGGTGTANWVTGTPYTAGTIVIHNNDYYRCMVDNTSTVDFEADYALGFWQEISQSSWVDTWQADRWYAVRDIVLENNVIYRCITSHRSRGAINLDRNKWIASGEGFKIPIPNDAAFILPNLLFDSTAETMIVVNVTTRRVDDITVNANKYTLNCHFINGAWSIVQNSIEFDINGWDGIIYSITAAGQVRGISDLMTGVYDVDQSVLLYKIAMRG